jgi:hypothetical protein
MAVGYLKIEKPLFGAGFQGVLPEKPSQIRTLFFYHRIAVAVQILVGGTGIEPVTPAV